MVFIYAHRLKKDIIAVMKKIKVESFKYRVIVKVFLTDLTERGN